MNYINIINKLEDYERTLQTVYNNVRRTCRDSFLRHCILSEIERVFPKAKEQYEIENSEDESRG